MDQAQPEAGSPAYWTEDGVWGEVGGAEVSVPPGQKAGLQELERETGRLATVLRAVGRGEAVGV